MEHDIEKDFFADLTDVICTGTIDEMAYARDDLGSVAKLFEEKERDLQLAATIGKSLLERNKELQQTNEFLEEQLNSATDQVTQLKHELQQKIDLLHIYTDNECNESAGTSPTNERVPDLGFLQCKVRLLEEENVSLKLEANHLKTLTQGLEQKEQQLVTDCVKRIADCNSQVEVKNTELLEKQERYECQRKQLNRLMNEVAEKTVANKTLLCENEELTLRVRAAEETQSELAQELLDLQERYAEVIGMLTESRQELKRFKENPVARYGVYTGTDDSLAYELEASDSGYSTTYDCHQPYSREFKNDGKQEKLIEVMQSVHNSMLNAERTSFSSEHGDLNTPLTLRIDYEQPSIASPNRHDTPARVTDDGVIEGVSPMLGNRISRVSSNESLCSYPGPGIGVPGIPGTKDLEFAIRRLTLRRRVEMEFARYQSERQSFLTKSTQQGRIQEPPITGTEVKMENQRHKSTFPFPVRSRLFLMKPLEGSETLAHWKELATPIGISSSLQRRPGIKVKGGNGSPPLTETQSSTSCQSILCSSSAIDRISKCNTTVWLSTGTACTFSFVNSQILHPSDKSCRTISRDTSSFVHGGSNLGICPRNDATTTFSTALNLAQALGERCVNLMTGFGSGLWNVRQSPMTVPRFSTDSIEKEHSATIRRCNFTKMPFNESAIAGLQCLVEDNEMNTEIAEKTNGVLSRTSL